MIYINFSEEEINQLNYERYHHPHPIVHKRMEALSLKSQELSHQEICRLCRISRPTLSLYLKTYLIGGIESLKGLAYQGQPSQLNQHQKTIEEYFRQNPPRNSAEASAMIEKLTGIKRSPTQIRQFMSRMGMKTHKVRDHAKELGIELWYLPSYSPHLNLIERLEKFVRNECLYSKYYETFDDFKKAISDCHHTANTKKKEKLATLLTWNFQSFRNVKFLAV